MKRALLALGVVVAAVFTACGGSDNDDAETPTSAAASVSPSDAGTPASTAPASPASDVTIDDPVLKQTIDALLSGDPAQVEAAIRLTPHPCLPNFPGPPCAEGQAAGTPVDSLPVVTCALELGASEDFIGAAVSSGVENSKAVYAVISGQSVPAGWLGEGVLGDGWFVITATERTTAALGAGWFIGEDGKILGMYYGCDHPHQPAERLLSVAGTPEFVVEPPK